MVCNWSCRWCWLCRIGRSCYVLFWWWTPTKRGLDIHWMMTSIQIWLVSVSNSLLYLGFWFQADALVRLLPLIGSSSIRYIFSLVNKQLVSSYDLGIETNKFYFKHSTACLIGITGILAPVLEETVFRGFFMVSLTKWYDSIIFLSIHIKQLYGTQIWSHTAICS